MNPSWRKPFGAFLIIGLIVLWSMLIVAASPWIGQLHALLQLPVYLVAGTIWVLPLKPLLRWIETGRWRAAAAAPPPEPPAAT